MVSLGSPSRTGPGPDDWFGRIAASPRPAVVDYAAGGDRVELSGRVLANWAAKTANLLDAEGLGRGATVALDLPAGWQSLAVLLGAARAGVTVVYAAADAAVAAELVVTDDPGAWAAAPSELWAVLGGEHPGASGPGGAAESALPAHALDFTAEVRVQGDQCPLPMPPGGLLALVDGEDRGGGAVELPAQRPDTARWSRRDRGLLVAARAGRLDRALARAAVEAWTEGLPVVLVPTDRVDDDGVARIASAEGLAGTPAAGRGREQGDGD